MPKSDIYGFDSYSYNSTFASFRAVQPLTSQIRWSLTWRIQIGLVLPSRKYETCFLRRMSWRPISFWSKRSLHITKGETVVFVKHSNLFYQHNVLPQSGHTFLCFIREILNDEKCPGFLLDAVRSAIKKQRTVIKSKMLGIPVSECRTWVQATNILVIYSPCE